jgi:hypothetical protein
MQRSDGLLGFIFDYPGEDVLPVLKICQDGGQITSAHATYFEGKLEVSGIVERNGVNEPPAGSYIEILVIDPRGTIASVATTYYFLRFIPIRNRIWLFPRSHFSAILPEKPSPGSKIEVVFRSASYSIKPNLLPCCLTNSARCVTSSYKYNGARRGYPLAIKHEPLERFPPAGSQDWQIPPRGYSLLLPELVPLPRAEMNQH